MGKNMHHLNVYFILLSLNVLFLLNIVQLGHCKGLQYDKLSNLGLRDVIKMRRGGCAAFGHSCFGGHGKRAKFNITPEVKDSKVNFKLKYDNIDNDLHKENSQLFAKYLKHQILSQRKKSDDENAFF